MPQIDPRRRQSRRMQLAPRIAPDDYAPLALSHLGQQQRERLGRNRPRPPEQLMHRPALKRPAGSQIIECI